MAEDLETIDEMDVDGRRVLLRADLDVPLHHGDNGKAASVADDRRLRAALTSIDELARRGARVVLVGHLGRRPGRDGASSMQPVADRLAQLTGAAVPVAPAVVGTRVRELTERLAPGQMLMLENTRFEPGETRNDGDLARALAELADRFVGDAFAIADRAYASTNGVAQRLPRAAGRVMEREVRALSTITERPERPLVAVIGGVGLSGKAGAITRLLGLADVLCLGGAICFPLLAAQGHSVGRSLCPREDVRAARAILAAAKTSACRLELPEDWLVTEGSGRETETDAQALDAVDVPVGFTALDTGPNTSDRFAVEIAAGATVFWDGPMGQVELASFAAGTRAIAAAIASARATTIVAGEETVQSVRSLGLDGHVSHVSTGGRATLAFLGGQDLPGVAVLRSITSARRGSLTT